jgi:glycine amidinotransferase/scyllo-inosamine-4-phosphate amidinotransferase 1
MYNKINRFDTFTKLRTVVLGELNYSLLTLLEDNQKDKWKRIYNGIDKTFTQIETIFKKFDIEVFRPKPIEVSTDLITPFYTMPACRSTISPFDNFLTISNTVVEMTSATESNFFDYPQYQHIWEKCWKNGSRWISMPRPRYEIDYNEPLADSPSFCLFGDTIFHSASECVNELGIQWIKNEFPEFNYIQIDSACGHLDSYFSILKPGVIISGLAKDKLPSCFNNWDFIYFTRENYDDITQDNELLQDWDYQNTTLGANCFSIDDENVLMLKNTIDSSPEKIKQIEKHKINVIPIDFEESRWVNQGLSCICNAIYRDGNKENYIK